MKKSILLITGGVGLLIIAEVILLFSLHKSTFHQTQIASSTSTNEASTTTNLDVINPWPELSSSTLIQEGSSTWKQYRIQEWAYGYQIEIPANWYALKDPDGQLAISITPTPCTNCNDFSPAINFYGTLNASSYNTQVKADLAQNTSTKTLTVDGYPAVQVIHAGFGDFPGDRLVYVFKGNDLYQFEIESNNPATEVFDHILATFKFLPPSPSLTYTNTQYGFTMQLPLSWKGFAESTGTFDIYSFNSSDGEKVLGTGEMIRINDPRSTTSTPYGYVPVMIFTPQQWKLVSGDNPQGIVSPAPIGPSMIGENNNYIFATPPRYNNVDAVNWGEVELIVDTFRAF
jgi:hypothetical protein